MTFGAVGFGTVGFPAAGTTAARTAVDATMRRVKEVSMAVELVECCLTRKSFVSTTLEADAGKLRQDGSNGT